jgi:hypothetical protein
MLTWTLWLACGVRTPEPDPAPAAEPATPRLVESRGLDADLAATQAFSATRPTYEQPLGVGLEVPAAVGSLSAAACGACHPAILAEWQSSTHAHAWTDRQFQAEITKSGNRWLCLNCHTPLLVQQDRWPVGLQDGDVELPLLVDNPAFDAALRDEGITCASCHVRDGVIRGPGLVDSTPPHPVQADPDFTTNAVCERCHQAIATYPGKQFICTFDTGNEWAAGPYPAEGKGCVDCHMPAVERSVAVGGPVRTVRQHWWRGAGVPKVAGVTQPVAANPPGLGLKASWGPDGLQVVMTNERAGHQLPTGDPERWVQVDVVFLDAEGQVVGEPWQVRLGQVWEWWPAPKKLDDTRLAPRASRTELLALPEGAERAEVSASSHRMTRETAEYHHLGDYPLSVETHRLEVSGE